MRMLLVNYQNLDDAERVSYDTLTSIVNKTLEALNEEPVVGPTLACGITVFFELPLGFNVLIKKFDAQFRKQMTLEFNEDPSACDYRDATYYFDSVQLASKFYPREQYHRSEEEDFS